MLTKAEKARYIAALRSGNYNQGRGAYRSGDRDNMCFCALGLLPAILEDDPLDDLSDYRYGNLMSECLGMADLYSMSLVSPGINRSLARAKYGVTFKDSITSLNDVDGWTFTQFADFFEDVLLTQD